MTYGLPNMTSYSMTRNGGLIIQGVDGMERAAGSKDKTYLLKRRPDLILQLVRCVCTALAEIGQRNRSPLGHLVCQENQFILAEARAYELRTSWKTVY